MKKLSLLITLSCLALIGSCTLVKAESTLGNAEPYQNSNSLIASDDDIEIEGLEDVQPEVIEPITSEVSEIYDVIDENEGEFWEKIAEISPK